MKTVDGRCTLLGNLDAIHVLTGIGVQLDLEKMAKYPYGPNNFLQLYEDGWERRSS